MCVRGDQVKRCWETTEPHTFVVEVNMCGAIQDWRGGNIILYLTLTRFINTIQSASVLETFYRKIMSASCPLIGPQCLLKTRPVLVWSRGFQKTHLRLIAGNRCAHVRSITITEWKMLSVGLTVRACEKPSQNIHHHVCFSFKSYYQQMCLAQLACSVHARNADRALMQSLLHTPSASAKLK